MTRYRSPPILFTWLLALALLFLAACGTFEIGIEHTATPANTITPGDGVTPQATAVTTKARRSTPFMATPTPTPVPARLLGVAFVKDSNAWLWTAEAKEAVPLTHTGDVSDGAIKISDDGATVAFTRGRELWAMDADGTGERKLVSEADFAAMEPADPGVSLYRFDWVPGTHILAFNTRLRARFGTNPTDDLHLVDAATLQHATLLTPGDGGYFYYSPDGSQIAMVRSGTIELMDADGENRRDGVLTYTPSKPYAEERYYAQPVWAADGSALGVAIPPVDPYAQPAQHTTIWHIPVDGTPARHIASIAAAPSGRIVFSPDLARVAYLRQAEGASARTDPASLLITELSNGETVTYYPQVHLIGEWAPDSQRFTFLPVFQSESQLPQAQIGRLGSDPVPVNTPADTVVLYVQWIDANRYLLLAKNVAQDTWNILLGGIGAPSTVLASIPERPGSDVPPYDFATVRPGTPEPHPPQAQIGQLGSDVVPAYGDADTAVIDVRWVDVNRYLFLAQSSRGWDILLGEIGGPSTVLATVTERPPVYDHSQAD